MRIAREGTVFILAPLGVFGAAAAGAWALALPGAAAGLAGTGILLSAFSVFFFRDPERIPPSDPDAVLSGADGVVRQVEEMPELRHLRTRTVRISVFLSAFNVHINRAPIGGVVCHLSYHPGRKMLAYLNAASEQNEHSEILIEGGRTRCLVKQIVGPVARRVVYTLVPGQKIGPGERIGLMKFGSRLDVYLPADEVRVVVKRGDRVVAGETMVARVTGEANR